MKQGRILQRSLIENQILSMAPIEIVPLSFWHSNRISESEIPIKWLCPLSWYNGGKRASMKFTEKALHLGGIPIQRTLCRLLYIERDSLLWLLRRGTVAIRTRSCHMGRTIVPYCSVCYCRLPLYSENSRSVSQDHLCSVWSEIFIFKALTGHALLS
jgi:hypothetical protein